MLAALELARILGRRRGGEQGKASRPHLLGGGPRQWRRPRLDWSAQINNKGMCELSGAHMVEEIVMLKTRVTAAAAADPTE